jgi:hypothetical protein
MRGNDLNHLPMSFLFGKPLLVVFGVGIAAIVGTVGFCVYWFVSHLQWVP